jgi:5-methyltetrahydropteroyltriglutamate--homocysteine methyltransferase
LSVVQPAFLARRSRHGYLPSPAPSTVELSTSLTGFFPRSERLVAATRDLDRGRTTPEAVEELRRQSSTEVLEVERRLGLSPATAGYLAWADLFRPFAEGWGGFKVGPVTRWFETNTFYRQPILNHPPERVSGAVARSLPAASGLLPAREAKVILPGPYTFAGLLDNRSGETNEALIHRLGRLLADEVAELRKLGYAAFQFQEPLLVVRPPKGPAAESVVAAYAAIGPAADGGQTIVWTYFADAAPAFPVLSRLAVGAVGVDLAETEATRLPPLPRKMGLGLGCVDPRTTLQEDPGELAGIVREVRTRLDPPYLHLGPGGPLDLLPFEPATKKLHVLPAVRQALRGSGS